MGREEGLMTSEQYDFVVIVSGPAGQKGAIAAAKGLTSYDRLQKVALRKE